MSGQPRQEPPGGASEPTTAGPRRRRRVVVRIAGVAGLIVLALAVWIVAPAVPSDGNDSFAARLAESARDKGFGFAVTGLEEVQYRLHPPQTGGSLDPADASSLAAEASGSSAPNPSPPPSATRSPGAPPSTTAATQPPPVALRPRIAPLASPALPGEGVFTARVQVGGQPAVQTALLRPDADHTSYLAGVAWLSSRLLRFEQHPGSADPGDVQAWSQPPTIPAQRRDGLVATFNSGFKIADSRGGYYQDGHTVGSLRTGAASFVVHRDGHADIGAWGAQVHLASDVVSVRQNLGLLVDGGRLSPGIDGDTQSTWGATLGGDAYVWRSGAGVTADGDIVFAVGNALSARSLAVLLQRAGAVRAMELDINPEWVSFMWYSPGSGGGDPVPHKIVDFARPADRYYTVNSRDFFAVYAR